MYLTAAVGMYTFFNTRFYKTLLSKRISDDINLLVFLFPLSIVFVVVIVFFKRFSLDVQRRVVDNATIGRIVVFSRKGGGVVRRVDELASTVVLMPSFFLSWTFLFGSNAAAHNFSTSYIFSRRTAPPTTASVFCNDPSTVDGLLFHCCACWKVTPTPPKKKIWKDRSISYITGITIIKK